MLVIGLHGRWLHPIAILLCDMIVYSEFLIHPVVLLSTSTRLRTEIRQTLQRLCQDTISNAMSEIYLCTRAILGCGLYHQRDHIYALNKSPIRPPSHYTPNHSFAQHIIRSLGHSINTTKSVNRTDQQSIKTTAPVQWVAE